MQAFICDAIRTPIGRYGGAQAGVPRFVVRCVLPGVAGTTRTSFIHRGDPPAAGAGSAAAAAKPTAQTAARRGFFKSLLDKLF